MHRAVCAALVGELNENLGKNTFGDKVTLVKDQNYIGEKKITCPYVKHKLRYQLGYTLQKFFSLRTTVDFVIIHPENVSSSHGFMLSQMFSYSFQQLPLQLSVNYGFFDTDNYESRLTTYEKGMLY